MQESFDKTAGYFEHGKTENGNYTDDPSTRVDWRGSQNLDGKTAREDVLLRLKQTSEENSAVKNPVYHVVVSWDSGDPETGREPDDPAPEEMEEAAKTLLDDLGLGEHEAWIVAHKDTDTPHLHIMANRVHPRTKRVWDDGSDYVKQYESLRKLEKEYGWNQTGPETIEEKWAEEKEDPLDYWEVAREKFGREMSFRQVARLTLERELREAKSWPELEEAVEEKGAALEPRNERGMIIRSGEEGVSLYKVARDSSRPRLEARFGQTWERYQEMKKEEYSREAIIADGRRRKDRLEAEISSMLDQRAVGRVDVLNERLMEAATPSAASASEASASEASASEASASGGNASEANPSRAGTGQLETGSGTGATRPPEERFEAGGGDLSQENTDHVYEGEPTGRRSSTSASGLDGAAQPSAPESMATPTSSSQPRRGRNDSAGTGSPDNGSAENAPSGNDRSGSGSSETPLDLRELRTQVKHLDAIERKKSAVVEARARGASSQAEAQERALERLEEANGSGDEIRREVGSAVNAMSIEEKKRFAQMTEKRVHPLIKEAAQFDKAETEREAQEAAQEAQAQQNSETLEYANRVFQESAQSLDEADPAKEYLRDRTYGQAEEVGVGYAPDSWRDLKISANGQGFSNEDLRNAGLTRKSNSDRPDYDAYSNQLTFPLRDKDNTLRGFTARWNDGAVDTARRPLDAKYINTSDEVVGFDKKKALFRDAAEGVEGNEVVVTEGPLDAMAARSAGEKAVALSGTRLSREHTDILRDVADDPDQTKAVVVLDGDQAGRDGTRDSLEALQREGIEADVVTLPEGQDLDEYIRENGAEEWRRYKAENRQTAVDFVREYAANPNGEPGKELGVYDRAEATKQGLDFAVAAPTPESRERTFEEFLESEADVEFNEGNLQDMASGEIETSGEEFQDALKEGAEFRGQSARDVYALNMRREQFEARLDEAGVEPPSWSQDQQERGGRLYAELDASSADALESSENAESGKVQARSGQDASFEEVDQDLRDEIFGTPALRESRASEETNAESRSSNESDGLSTEERPGQSDSEEDLREQAALENDGETNASTETNQSTENTTQQRADDMPDTSELDTTELQRSKMAERLEGAREDLNAARERQERFNEVKTEAEEIGTRDAREDLYAEARKELVGENGEKVRTAYRKHLRSPEHELKREDGQAGFGNKYSGREDGDDFYREQELSKASFRERLREEGLDAEVDGIAVTEDGSISEDFGAEDTVAQWKVTVYNGGREEPDHYIVPKPARMNDVDQSIISDAFDNEGLETIAEKKQRQIEEIENQGSEPEKAAQERTQQPTGGPGGLFGDDPAEQAEDLSRGLDEKRSELQAEFESKVEEVFEKPEEALQAYQNNREKYGDARARKVMIDPEADVNRDVERPGEQKDGSAKDVAAMTRLDQDLEKIDERAQALQSSQKEETQETKSEADEPVQDASEIVIEEGDENRYARQEIRDVIPGRLEERRDGTFRLDERGVAGRPRTIDPVEKADERLEENVFRAESRVNVSESMLNDIETQENKKATGPQKQNELTVGAVLSDLDQKRDEYEDLEETYAQTREEAQNEIGVSTQEAAHVRAKQAEEAGDMELAETAKEYRDGLYEGKKDLLDAKNDALKARNEALNEIEDLSGEDEEQIAGRASEIAQKYDALKEEADRTSEEEVEKLESLQEQEEIKASSREEAQAEAQETDGADTQETEEETEKQPEETEQQDDKEPAQEADAQEADAQEERFEEEPEADRFADLESEELDDKQYSLLDEQARLKQELKEAGEEEREEIGEELEQVEDDLRDVEKEQLMREPLSYVESEKERLETQEERLQGDLEEAQQQVGQAEREIERLETRIEGGEEGLEKDLGEAEIDLEEASERQETVENDLEVVQDRREMIGEVLGEEEQISTAEEEAEKEGPEEEERAVTLEELETEKERLLDEREGYTEELSEYDEEIEAAEERLEMNETRLELSQAGQRDEDEVYLQEQISVAEDDIQTAEANKRMVEMDIEDTDEKIQEVEEEIERVDGQDLEQTTEGNEQNEASDEKENARGQTEEEIREEEGEKRGEERPEPVNAEEQSLRDVEEELRTIEKDANRAVEGAEQEIDIIENWGDSDFGSDEHNEALKQARENRADAKIAAAFAVSERKTVQEEAEEARENGPNTDGREEPVSVEDEVQSRKEAWLKENGESVEGVSKEDVDRNLDELQGQEETQTREENQTQEEDQTQEVSEQEVSEQDVSEQDVSEKEVPEEAVSQDEANQKEPDATDEQERKDPDQEQASGQTRDDRAEDVGGQTNDDGTVIDTESVDRESAQEYRSTRQTEKEIDVPDTPEQVEAEKQDRLNRMEETANEVNESFDRTYENPEQAKAAFEEKAYQQGVTDRSVAYDAARTSLDKNPEQFGELRGNEIENGIESTQRLEARSAARNAASKHASLMEERRTFEKDYGQSVSEAAEERDSLQGMGSVEQNGQLSYLRGKEAGNLASELKAERKDLEEEFRSEAAEVYDDSEKALDAYDRNEEAYGAERARKVMLNPGGHSEGAFADPGSVSETGGTRIAKMQDLDRKISDVKQREDVARAIEEKELSNYKDYNEDERTQGDRSARAAEGEGQTAEAERGGRAAESREQTASGEEREAGIGESDRSPNVAGEGREAAVENAGQDRRDRDGSGGGDRRAAGDDPAGNAIDGREEERGGRRDRGADAPGNNEENRSDDGRLRGESQTNAVGAENAEGRHAEGRSDADRTSGGDAGRFQEGESRGSAADRGVEGSESADSERGKSAGGVSGRGPGSIPGGDREAGDRNNDRGSASGERGAEQDGERGEGPDGERAGRDGQPDNGTPQEREQPDRRADRPAEKGDEDVREVGKTARRAGEEDEPARGEERRSGREADQRDEAGEDAVRADQRTDRTGSGDRRDRSASDLGGSVDKDADERGPQTLSEGDRKELESLKEKEKTLEQRVDAAREGGEESLQRVQDGRYTVARHNQTEGANRPSTEDARKALDEESTGRSNMEMAQYRRRSASKELQETREKIDEIENQTLDNDDLNEKREALIERRDSVANEVEAVREEYTMARDDVRRAEEQMPLDYKNAPKMETKEDREAVYDKAIFRPEAEYKKEDMNQLVAERNSAAERVKKVEQEMERRGMDVADEKRQRSTQETGRKKAATKTVAAMGAAEAKEEYERLKGEAEAFNQGQEGASPEVQNQRAAELNGKTRTLKDLHGNDLYRGDGPAGDDREASQQEEGGTELGEVLSEKQFLENKREEIEGEKNELESQIAGAYEEKAEAQQELQEASEIDDPRERNLASVEPEARLEEQEEKIDALGEEIGEMKTDLNAIDEKDEMLDQKIDDYIENTTEESPEQRKSVAKALEEKRTLDQEVKGTKNDLREMRREGADTDQIESVQENVADLQTQKEEVDKRVAGFEKAWTEQNGGRERVDERFEETFQDQKEALTTPADERSETMEAELNSLRAEAQKAEKAIDREAGKQQDQAPQEREAAGDGQIGREPAFASETNEAEGKSLYDIAREGDREGAFDKAGSNLKGREAALGRDAEEQDIDPETIEQARSDVEKSVDELTQGEKAEKILGKDEMYVRVQDLERKEREMAEIASGSYKDVHKQRSQAERELEHKMVGIYGDKAPEARENFEEAVDKEGFDAAVKKMARRPESFAETKEGATVGWKDREAADMDVASSAEGLNKYPKDSVARAAAKNDLAKAVEVKKREQTPYSFMKDTLQQGESPKEITDEEMSRAEESLNGLQDEFNRVKAERMQYPSKRQLEREMKAEIRSSNEETLDRVISEGESRAISADIREKSEKVMDSDDEMDRAFKKIYEDPDIARARFEGEAFKDGIDSESDAFKKAEAKLYRTPEQFGEVKDKHKLKDADVNTAKEWEASDADAKGETLPPAVKNVVGMAGAKAKNAVKGEEGEQSEDDTQKEVKKSAGQAGKAATKAGQAAASAAQSVSGSKGRSAASVGKDAAGAASKDGSVSKKVGNVLTGAKKERKTAVLAARGHANSLSKARESMGGRSKKAVIKKATQRGAKEAAKKGGAKAAGKGMGGPAAMAARKMRKELSDGIQRGAR